ncbi:S1/P1 nuclease [Shewanella corallii]|uniref:S1/P1 nuclease n=1 Tax=Shewanella corallii TaxID=560080 RepID=A0ABT0NDR7_9GAMM|nr:S1/P1 nuclease [Shewanella corallii]MCL2915976.1 S1/P1 nuclease [Shewanella corallii]
MRNILFGAQLLALILVPAMFSSNALAWGQNGHRVIGQVAENHLTPNASMAVAALLGEDSLAEVSTWADEMRSNPDEMWQGMHHWHYINMNGTNDFNPDAYKVVADTPHKDIQDIYGAILKSIAVLESTTSSQQEKAFHLKLLTHMVGDIHQPMHAGHKHDKGGNDVDVEFFRSPTNLHALWDTKLIESLNLSYTELSAFIDTNNSSLIDEALNSAPSDWVLESHTLAQRLYQQPKTGLSYRYIYDFMPLVKQRLLQGGVRLAGLLNQIFDDSATMPVSGKTGVGAETSNLSTQKYNR